MIYLKVFLEHTSYEAEVNGGGQDFEIPNVSYCKDVDDVHFNPYNLIEFYVGEITEPQTVSIYTDERTSIGITVSKGNKWYSYLLPKDKGLYSIEGDSVKKVIVKADMANYNVDKTNGRFPSSIIEASFKGSNTSKVTYMNYMFDTCYNLISLDLSSFNTSNVTSMDSMFQECNSLKSLDLSSFNTSKVTNMNCMFYGCRGLTSLDLSNFNTSNVTEMASMFSKCSGLTSLDLSNFDTSKVTNMDNMFNGCSGLTSLTLSGWDTSKVTDITEMFDGCSNLTKIKMVGCSQDTIQKITNVKPSGATIVTGQTI